MKITNNDYKIFNMIKYNDLNGFKQEFNRLNREKKLSLINPNQAQNLLQYIIDTKNKKMIEHVANSIIKNKSFNEVTNIENYTQNFVKDYIDEKIPDKRVASLYMGFSQQLFKDGKFDFYKKESPLVVLAHLNSWHDISKKNKYVKEISNNTNELFPNSKILNLEGFTSREYSQWKITQLLDDARKINTKYTNDLCVSAFGETKDSIVNKLKKEIENQIESFHISETNKTLRKLKSSDLNPSEAKLCDKLFKIHVDNISNKLTTLKSGDSLFLHVSAYGHYTQVEFKKENNGTLTRQIYNLGAGIDRHQLKGTKVLPHIVTGISSNFFSDKKGRDYLENILNIDSVNKEKNKDPISSLIYQKNKVSFYNKYYNKLDGSKKVISDPRVAQKMQSAGNCSVKNSNSGIKQRLQNEKLFKWLKTNEQKELVDICKKTIPNLTERTLINLEYKNDDSLFKTSKIKNIIEKALNCNSQFSNEEIISRLDKSLKNSLQFKFQVNTKDLTPENLKNNLSLVSTLIDKGLYNVNSKNKDGQDLLTILSSIDTNKISGIRERSLLCDKVIDVAQKALNNGATLNPDSTHTKSLIELSSSNNNRLMDFIKNNGEVIDTKPISKLNVAQIIKKSVGKMMGFNTLK